MRISFLIFKSKESDLKAEGRLKKIFHTTVEEKIKNKIDQYVYFQFGPLNEPFESAWTM